MTAKRTEAMRWPVQSYRLPETAPALDRWTLAAWRFWDAWFRPFLAATLLMAIGFGVAAALTVLLDRTPGQSQWWILAGWRQARATPFVVVDRAGNPEPVSSPSGAWVAAIAVQVVGSVAGALAAWPVLQRHRSPVLLGALAALAFTVLHVSNSLLLDLKPIPLAPVTYNAAAIAALWSMPMFAVVFALVLVRRRGRGPSTRAGTHDDG